jgi:hypothetical protein
MWVVYAYFHYGYVTKTNCSARSFTTLTRQLELLVVRHLAYVSGT